MPKDLREMIKNESVSSGNLSKNHRQNFEARLRKELHGERKSGNQFLRIAASFIIVGGLAAMMYFFIPSNGAEQQGTAKIESLGSISPELKKIENYYLASINEQIASLEETPENKEILDGYLEKIGELTQEYRTLTDELNAGGLNENTINALIDNLQLRLKLLYQLKEQLNELKKQNITKNENVQA